MMRVVGDFHIHSRYAMACSRDINIESLGAAAEIKGVNVLGTGDFTHPDWFDEIKEMLVEEGDTGLFRIKKSTCKTKFILSSEVSTIFSYDDKIRKIHNCLLFSNMDSVESFNEVLGKYGSLSSDGRPILSMSAAELVELAFEADKDAFVFPAHAWTPYFGVFGSMTGFDTMKEAYLDQEYRIHALETGLSSDPGMNWRISALDKYALLSNSDMHSTAKMGREANVFDLDENKVSYHEIIDAITKKDKNRFVKTIEFYPEEGKYHYDGHRPCAFFSNPEEQLLERCPICGKKLVLGVLRRINELADRPSGTVPESGIPYQNMIPLNEIISEMTDKGVYSQHVKGIYDSLITEFGTEFFVLESADPQKISEVAGKEIADGIRRMREDKVSITPGYDGVFGKISVSSDTPAQPPKPTVKQRGIMDI
jgi:uncharacterized protein (TIGR00375 family)